jgi:hypothetical protein
MTWGWSFLEFIPRWQREDEEGLQRRKLIIPFFARRLIPSGAHIHQSVIDRANRGTKMPNIPEEYLIE